MLYCSQEKETGELLFSIIFRRREYVHYCYQEKETGALMFQEKDLVLYCFRRRDLVHYRLQFSRRRKLMLYCSYFQEKGTGFYRFYLYKTLIFICISR